MNESHLDYHHRIESTEQLHSKQARSSLQQEQGRLLEIGTHTMSAFLLENVKIAEFFQHADLAWCRRKLTEIFEDSSLTFDFDAATERPTSIFKTPAWNAAAVLIDLARGGQVYTKAAQKKIRGGYSENRGDGVVVKLKQKPEHREPYSKENYMANKISNTKTREMLEKR